eukprot:gene2198-3368_t
MALAAAAAQLTACLRCIYKAAAAPRSAAARRPTGPNHRASRIEWRMP